MKIIKTIGFCLLLAISSNCDAQDNKTNQSIPAHAHNDYNHRRPLLDALDCKFKSIEADVFSVGDSLFVAHDFDKIKPGRTLRELYLNPLKDIVAKNNGSVYGDSEELILLVDIKNDGLTTYKLLHQILEGYKEILTSYHSGTKKPGAVTVIVSGNRPKEYMLKQENRYAGYDGRIPDLESGMDASFMPLVSDNWNKYFKWKGKGEMPVAEKDKLHQFAKMARQNGYLLRFWANPDRPGPERIAVWNELKNAHVNLIGTDDLKGLQSMFLKQ
jgi:hypothetical protein